MLAIDFIERAVAPGLESSVVARRYRQLARGSLHANFRLCSSANLMNYVVAQQLFRFFTFELLLFRTETNSSDCELSSTV